MAETKMFAEDARFRGAILEVAGISGRISTE
jgi:hypothetical protein